MATHRPRLRRLDRDDRSGVVVAVLGLFTLSVLGRLMLAAAGSSWPSGHSQASAEDVLAGIVAWAGLGLCVWLWATFLLAILTALPGTVGLCAARAAETITPVMVRRALSLVLGASVGTLGLPTDAALGDGEPARVAQLQSSATVSPDPAVSATGMASPASSVSPASPAFRATPRAVRQDTVAQSPRSTLTSTAAPVTRTNPESAEPPPPGWRPSRPATVHDAESSQLLAPVPRRVTAPVETVTVRRGDSLWSIAARHLGAGATDAEIAVAWPAWHALNADLIGDDPDLIHPGLRLRVPTDGDHP
jgi:nucleoid-associated protein YgaU